MGGGYRSGGDNWNSGGNDFSGGFGKQNFGDTGWNRGNNMSQWYNKPGTRYPEYRETPGTYRPPTEQGGGNPAFPKPRTPEQQYQNGGLTVAQPLRPEPLPQEDMTSALPFRREPQVSQEPPIPQTIAPTAFPAYRPGGLTAALPNRQEPDPNNVQPPTPQTIATPTVTPPQPTYSPFRTQLSQMDNNSFMSMLRQLLNSQSFNQYQTPMSGTNSLYNRYGR